MATVHTGDDVLVPLDVIEPLELLIFAAIGITSVALAMASAGELTLAQWRALVLVGRGGSIRVSSISTAIGTSLSSASRLVRRLETRGFVTTERDETDRRATLVRATDRGLRIREAVIDCRRGLIQSSVRSSAPRLPPDLASGMVAIADAFAEYG